jgi:hypothetical protein
MKKETEKEVSPATKKRYERRGREHTLRGPSVARRPAITLKNKIQIRLFTRVLL